VTVSFSRRIQLHGVSSSSPVVMIRGYGAYCVPCSKRLTVCPDPSAEVKNAWSYTSTPPCVFMVWRSTKHRDNFTFAQYKN